MKCIICDRCGKVIEDQRQVRVFTYAKPFVRYDPYVPYRGDDKQKNDILWEKDLCVECAEEAEAAFNPVQPDGKGDENNS